MTMKVTIKTPFAELNLDMPQSHVLSWLHQTLIHAATVAEPKPVTNSVPQNPLLEDVMYTHGRATTASDTVVNKEASYQAEKTAVKSRAESMFGSRETWNTPAAAPKPEQTEKREAYGGFLHVKCEACGQGKSFKPKQPITYFICDCGSRTDLDNMAPVFVHCKCGREFKYRTNRTEERFTMNCFACGAPVDLELNGKGDAYVTVGWRI